eukprot:TRINITY_DN4641_c0_g2_i1.p2 TRINITY_DN4641_c0_g2~~TRINITY_DN4641_c0_g2_i1.p2  ORF type:complete len:183 (+),score=35.13 TRINITY_DN4641_c0_g2_i1:306-854(+)
MTLAIYLLYAANPYQASKNDWAVVLCFVDILGQVNTTTQHAAGRGLEASHALNRRRIRSRSPMIHDDFASVLYSHATSGTDLPLLAAVFMFMKKTSKSPLAAELARLKACAMKHVQVQISFEHLDITAHANNSILASQFVSAQLGCSESLRTPLANVEAWASFHVLRQAVRAHANIATSANC